MLWFFSRQDVLCTCRSRVAERELLKLQVVALVDVVRVLRKRGAFGRVRLQALQQAMGALPSTVLLMVRSLALSGTFSLVVATVSKCAFFPRV